MHIMYAGYVHVDKGCYFHNIPYQAVLKTNNTECNNVSHYFSIKIRNIRRNGSAAPHNNWSPTVKADK